MENNIIINCQSSIKIVSDKIIYFDPFKITTEDHDADLIFLTHDHYDHFDEVSIKKIQKEDTILVIPESIASKVMDSNLKIKIMQVVPNKVYSFLGYQVTTIPSYNINKKFHLKEYNYVGYVIDINNEKIYVAGDIDAIPEAKNLKVDIALVPIGGVYTMTYQEAAHLINEMKPQVAIPTHYQSVVGSLEDAYEFQKLVNPKIKTMIIYK